jgi:hypothetical protein
MRVRDKDLLQFEAERRQASVNVGNVIARIDDDSLTGLRVGKDGAIALQGTDGEGLNHGACPDEEAVCPDEQLSLVPKQKGPTTRLAPRRNWIG